MNNTNCSDDNIHVLFHLYCFKHRYFMVWLVKEIDGKFHCRIWKICWSLRHLWLIWKISLTGINLAIQQIQPLQGCQRLPQIGSYWSQIGQIWDFFSEYTESDLKKSQICPIWGQPWNPKTSGVFFSAIAQLQHDSFHLLLTPLIDK